MENAGRNALALAALALALAPLGAARADRVTVKGTTLEGTIQAVTREGIVLETIYGKGTLTIPHADIEALESEGRFYVFHGREETVGRLLGEEEGALVVGEQGGPTERIELASLHSVVPAETIEKQRFGWLRRDLRFWTGGLDLGFSATDATTNSTSLALGLRAERREKPTRLLFTTTYLYGTEKSRGGDKNKLNNEIRALLRGDYDLSKRLYVFAAGDGEYDEIERLSIRTSPRAGLGYRVYETKTSQLDLEAGLGWVYERFFGGDDNDFVTLPLGAEYATELPLGAKWRTRVDYLPSVAHWIDDFLLRGETGLSFPVAGPFSLRASLVDAYDSTPAANTDKNSLTGILSLGVGF